MNFEQTKKFLQDKGQEGLLQYYDVLNGEQQQKLLSAVGDMDWSFEDALKNPEDLSGVGSVIEPIDGLKIPQIQEQKEGFFTVGKEAVQKGKVAAVLLAGGQGTRLGSDAPKGAYNIGETKPLYIFEQQINNLLEVVKSCGAYVPLYIMTSEKNHEETVQFWKEHHYFSYPESEIAFFKQEMSPATDFNGKIYLEERYLPALSPNGNGGWFSSLRKAGLDKDMQKRGVEWINIYAVDNVLQRIADPVFVGATILSKVNCGAKVVCKNRPEEKVGVLCLQDGKPSVIEYYELTEEMANQREKDGSLSYCYGVILNYLFRLQTLNEIADTKIPVHIVKKKIPHLDENGQKVTPETENGYKFETLVVDLVRHTGSVLPFEVEREKEFAPIKNKTGIDSVESARELLKKNGVEL
ncbi:MAG: UDPGP type 1 family protein [Clostridia bacterium]|nr:UDPGP type 1 family protein [Clostridia bacterium]